MENFEHERRNSKKAKGRVLQNDLLVKNNLNSHVKNTSNQKFLDDNDSSSKEINEPFEKL